MTPTHALEASGVARWMREALWAYPAVEAVHIVALGTLFGSILIVDLRLLGLSRDVSAVRLARHALPWTVGAFVLAMITGLLMFTAHAEDFLTNGVFVLKMGLILAAGLNAGLLHTGALRTVAQWDTAALPPASVRVSAGLSIAIWIAVIACGRLLAYT
ncbi:MAG: hypothetical protein IT518_26965 [Burkholderiales bacterium]|nr:hypothetical protein [Burkholderiales bacterium]